MSTLSDTFGCERFAKNTNEQQEKGVVTSNILNNHLQKTIQEVHDDTDNNKTIESYKAGIAAGAIKLVQIGQERQHSFTY